jgi:hypothetical protein
MRRAAPILSGVGLVVAVAAAVVAARHAVPADSSPVRPGGTWGTVWPVALVAGFACYGLGIVSLGRGRTQLVLATADAVIVQALPLAAPLLLSRDVYLYWAEARVVTVHHANPYRVEPSTYPDDPGTRAASPQWRTETEPYGPTWVAVGAVPALAAGGSKVKADAFYRVLAFVGILVLLAIVFLRTRSARSVAMLGWSPLIALHYAGGGHSDAWLTVALAVAVALPGTAVSGSAWAVGSAFKAVPAILLPLELARARLRLPKRFWVALVATGVVLIVASTALFGVRWATAGLIGVHGTSPIGGVHLLTEAGLRHRYAVLACSLLFAVVYVLLARDAWRTGRSRLALAATALCLLSSLLRPWYALWPVALAALEEDGVSLAAAYGLSCYLLFADATAL